MDNIVGDVYVFLLMKILLPIILGVTRQKAQEWCIKHSFELVELSPEELPEEDGKCSYVLGKHGIWIQIQEIIQGRRIRVNYESAVFTPPPAESIYSKFIYVAFFLIFF